MIYFVQPFAGGPIKIGTTISLASRVKQLEALYQVPLAILGTMDGGRKEELAIHRRFSRARLGRTEQFRPTPELLGFIGLPLLAKKDVEAVKAMPQLQGATVVILGGSNSYVRWLEDAHRKTHLPKATIVRLAIAEWAQNNGHPLPPEF